MDILVFSCGVTILLMLYSDLFYTTLSTNGAGVISGFISRNIWKIILFLKNKLKADLLKFGGIMILLSIFISWIMMAWAGYSLIYQLDPSNIFNTKSDAPASFWDKWYYAGYTLSTLGYGDFYVEKTGWKLFSVITSLSGLSIVTIAITYLIQVISSEIAQRQLALHISTFGQSSEEILINILKENGSVNLQSQFESISLQVLSHSQHMLAYPVIHYFHASKLRDSAAINLAILDEALSILLIVQTKEEFNSNVKYTSLRKSLTVYLQTMEDGEFVKPANIAPAIPDLTALLKLEAFEVPTANLIKRGYDSLEYRRKIWKSIIEHNGRNWNDLYIRRNKKSLDIENV